MTTQEFNQKIESGEAKVLTLEKAKSLIGKTIFWTYFGYRGNQQDVYETTIGNILSDMQYNETQPLKGWSSRAEYWCSYMNKRQLDEVNNTLLIVDANNNNTFMYCHLIESCFDEPTFTCSDADRCVFYIEK